jgi:eukaryotic-like serine/threonine-protein kinase
MNRLHSSLTFKGALGAVLILSLAHLSSAAQHGAATAHSWPMFRGNPGLTGVSPAEVPSDPKLLWTYTVGKPVKSSPAISGGKVYIGADDGQLHCLDLAAGKKVWSFKTGGPIESSPLVLGEHIYFGSSDGFLYALTLAGKEAWKFQTDDKILGSPTWVKAPDGQGTWILAGSYDYKLYSFDAVTGRTNWSYETGNYINGTPAVAQGKAVFGGCDAVLHLVALNTGEKAKEVEIGAYIAGSGAFENGRVYIGHYDNEFICVDTQEGKIAWRYKDRAFPYFSSPALTEDRVVVGGRDKKLHCLKKSDGTQLWTFNTKGKVDSSPVVTKGGEIIFGSADGRVYIVDLKDGKELWSYEIGEGITSSPAVVDGLFVIGSDDGSVYAFGKN